MIYVHFPFCRSFCTYCDFYSVVSKGKMGQYAEALLREIDSQKGFFRACPPDSIRPTVYFGGGTPSLMPVADLERICEALKAGFPSHGRPCEFTMEVNPDDVNPESAAAWKEMGVTRISMGVQSFDDDVLSRMARRHNSAKARDAFRILREAGFDNISLDLIYGYDLSWRRLGWEYDLESVCALAPEHISSYQMTLEGDSALVRLASKGKYTEPSDAECEAEYRLLQDVLAKAGYRQYEVSSWAKEGRESRHNSGYWTRLPYLGLGPAAHSYDGARERSWNPSDLDAYLAGAPRQSETLDEEQLREEELLLGLRCAEGVRPGAADKAAAQRLLADGLLEYSPSGNLRIPPAHLFISEWIIENLL